MASTMENPRKIAEQAERDLNTYEAKTGAEFGGLEDKYKAAEARAKAWRKGMWGGKGPFESPREYKRKIAEGEAIKDLAC